MSLPIFSYNKQCANTQGEINSFYISPYVKYKRSQLVFNDTKLTKFPETNFYYYECDGNYNQSSEMEGGAFYFNQTLSIRLPKVYNNINPVLFLKQDYRVIATTNNGYYLMFGIFNGLEAKISNSSGSNKSEFNGFDLSFTGKEDVLALSMDNLNDINIIDTDSEFFNYTLNFNL